MYYAIYCALSGGNRKYNVKHNTVLSLFELTTTIYFANAFIYTKIVAMFPTPRIFFGIVGLILLILFEIYFKYKGRDKRIVETYRQQRMGKIGADARIGILYMILSPVLTALGAVVVRALIDAHIIALT